MVFQNNTINASFNSVKIIISDLKEITLLDINQIIYCKAEDNYARIYLIKRNFLVTKTLKYVESTLPKKTFVRNHKSFLVNINYIVGIKNKNTIILKSDIELPIARRRKKKFFNILYNSNLLIC